MWFFLGSICTMIMGSSSFTSTPICWRVLLPSSFAHFIFCYTYAIACAYGLLAMGRRSLQTYDGNTKRISLQTARYVISGCCLHQVSRTVYAADNKWTFTAFTLSNTIFYVLCLVVRFNPPIVGIRSDGLFLICLHDRWLDLSISPLFGFFHRLGTGRSLSQYNSFILMVCQ